MFELSDYLVGIYKVKDCTDSVCIQNEPPKMPLIESQQLQNQTQTQILHSQPAHIHVVPTAGVSDMTATQPSQILADKSVSLNDSIDSSPPPETAANNDAPPSSQQENNENCASVATVLSHSAPQACNKSTFAPQGESTAVTSSQLLSDGRQSGNMTFIPQGESTALSQTLQMDMTRTSIVHGSQNAAFTDSQFKKPLPPVTSN